MKSLVELQIETERVRRDLAIVESQEETEVQDALKRLDLYLEQLTFESKQTVDVTRYLMDKIKPGVKYLRERAQEFTTGARALESFQRRLTERVKEVMRYTGQEEVKGHLWRFLRIPMPPAVEVDNPFELQQRYPELVDERVTTELIVNEDKVREILQSGIELPGGCRLVQRDRLMHYVNKGDL